MTVLYFSIINVFWLLNLCGAGGDTSFAPPANLVLSCESLVISTDLGVRCKAERLARLTCLDAICEQQLYLLFCRAKAKRQYLLTLQVSRYCLLALQSSTALPVNNLLHQLCYNTGPGSVL